MGTRTDFEIAEWQRQAGIEPATGERAKILDALQNACFQAIRILELEKSGICDGDGRWHGSDVIGHVMQQLIELCHRLRRPEIDDTDVFDSMRALLRDGVDLDDRAAVERQILNPYENNPALSKRFIDWCIKAAKANLVADLVAGGLNKFGSEGFVPPEDA